jgi:putative membrane protein
VRRGLTALSSQTIARTRIQGLVVSEPVLWRLVGWARLEVSVAGYRSTDPDRVAASSTLVPVADRDEVLALVGHLLGRSLESVPLAPAPRRARWRAPLTAWTLALGQDDALLVSRRGFWVRRLDVVPQARVQSLRVAQGPVQRLLRLADLHVDSPPGPVRVRGAHRSADGVRPFAAAAVDRGRAARGHGPAQRPGSTPTPDTTQ